LVDWIYFYSSLGINVEGKMSLTVLVVPKDPPVIWEKVDSSGYNILGQRYDHKVTTL
jgi:hypothetical protein